MSFVPSDHAAEKTARNSGQIRGPEANATPKPKSHVGPQRSGFRSVWVVRRLHGAGGTASDAAGGGGQGGNAPVPHRSESAKVFFFGVLARLPKQFDAPVFAF